jgi:hypothetical protein
VLGLAEGLCGLGAGILLGCLAWPATRFSPSGGVGRFAAIAELAIVGSFLGWQAVAAVATAATVTYFAVSALAAGRPRIGRIGWSTCLAFVTFAWIVGWSSFTGQEGLRASVHGAERPEYFSIMQKNLGPQADPMLLAYTGAAVAGAALLTWALRRRQTRRPGTP